MNPVAYIVSGSWYVRFRDMTRPNGVNTQPISKKALHELCRMTKVTFEV